MRLRDVSRTRASEKDALEHFLSHDEFKRVLLAVTHGQDIPDDLMDKLYAFFVEKMPYGTAKARTGDPHEWISDRIEDIILGPYRKLR